MRDPGNEVEVKSTWDQAAYITTAYPGFCSMKRLEVSPLHSGWVASPLQRYPQTIHSLYPTWVELGKVREIKVSCTGMQHSDLGYRLQMKSIPIVLHSPRLPEKRVS